MSQSLNRKHSKKDIKLFSLKKKSYVEEDVFKYFYPFCLLNLPICTIAVLRKHFSVPFVALMTVSMVEYVYLVFSFPIESHLFHSAALNENKPYGHYIRTSYVNRFPDSEKAKLYKSVENSQKCRCNRIFDKYIWN